MSRLAIFISIPCPFCKGSGVVPEYHGPGLTEYLGCQECRGTGDVPGSRRIVEPDYEVGLQQWRDSRRSSSELEAFRDAVTATLGGTDE